MCTHVQDKKASWLAAGTNSNILERKPTAQTKVCRKVLCNKSKDEGE